MFLDRRLRTFSVASGDDPGGKKERRWWGDEQERRDRRNAAGHDSTASKNKRPARARGAL